MLVFAYSGWNWAAKLPGWHSNATLDMRGADAGP